MLVNDNTILKFPLRVVLGFLIFTEILYFFGPIQFDVKPSILLPLYLVIVNFALWLGYELGVKYHLPSKYRFSMTTTHIILILGLVLSVFKLKQMWASHGLPISINTLISGIMTPADTYFAESTDPTTQSGGTITLLLSPLLWASLPLGVFKWKRLTPLYKIITVSIILIQVISWLGIGTRKGLFDVIIILVFVCIAACPNFITDKKLFRRFKRLFIFCFLLFVFYFIFSNLSRYGIGLSDIEDFDIQLEIRPFYVNYLPMWLVIVLFSISIYLCQGYYALSLALSLGIKEPTILGSSWFTMVIANKFGLNPMPDTYLADLQQWGIDPSINWHTIYVWLANDVTFIGVPFLIFIIGYLFAKTWVDSVRGQNEAAIPLFALFLIMIFYFYANNQVLSFSFVPFIVWLALYFLSRIRR